LMDPLAREIRVAAVTGQTGTTLLETFNLTWTAEVYIMLSLLCVFSVANGKPASSWVASLAHFFIEFLLLVIPLTYHCTFWDEPVVIAVVALFALACLALILSVHFL